MTAPVTSTPTTAAEFRNSVTSSVLSGGAGKDGATSDTITGAASLQDAIAAGVLGNGSDTAGDLTYSSLLTGLGDTTDLEAAISNAVLGSNGSSDTISNLAALGSTLNAMAATAQSALVTTNTADRSTALATYQSLYDSLNAADTSVDGNAGNAASLGIDAPGNWADTNTAAGTAAITADMTSVVKAHTVVQQMIQSVGQTYLDSLLL